MRIRFLHLIAFLSCSACAGSLSTIRLDQAKYPVSFSPVTCDGRRNLREDQLEKVGKFEHAYTTYHMLWRWVPLGPSAFDLSDEVNQQIEAAGGLGIVNFALYSEAQAGNAVLAVLGGILPGSAHVRVSGDIVRPKGRY
jgi:hypothetical protein